jgi:hypothetical protein
LDTEKKERFVILGLKISILEKTYFKPISKLQFLVSSPLFCLLLGHETFRAVNRRLKLHSFLNSFNRNSFAKYEKTGLFVTLRVDSVYNAATLIAAGDKAGLLFGHSHNLSLILASHKTTGLVTGTCLLMSVVEIVKDVDEEYRVEQGLRIV